MIEQSCGYSLDDCKTYSRYKAKLNLINSINTEERNLKCLTDVTRLG